MSGQYVAPRTGTLPLGVALLAILIGLVGVLLLFVAVAVIVVFTGLAFFSQFSLFGVGLVGGVLLLVFSIILLAVAFGLWHQELWALALSIIVLLVLLISNVVRGDLVSLSSLILFLLLIYLAAVRQHFD
jgi:hypothetical protein